MIIKEVCGFLWNNFELWMKETWPKIVPKPNVTIFNNYLVWVFLFETSDLLSDQILTILNQNLWKKIVKN